MNTTYTPKTLHQIEWFPLARQHSDWVSGMGWTHNTPLELLAMVAAEIGKVSEACLQYVPQATIIDELVDVLLRLANMSIRYNFSLDEYLPRVHPPVFKGDVSDVARLTACYGRLAQAAHKRALDEDFGVALATLFAAAFNMASLFEPDVLEAIRRKMQKNSLRTR